MIKSHIYATATFIILKVRGILYYVVYGSWVCSIMCVHLELEINGN